MNYYTVDYMIKTLYSIAVMVSDGKKAAEWYKEKLGFEIANESEHWITAAPKGSSTVLHLCQANKDGGFELEPGVSGIAFEVDNLDKTYEELSKKGVEFSQKPIDKGWGRFAIFKDPDNNEFHLYE